MRRMILKWLISRSIDEDLPIAAWLRRRIDADPELRQFEIQSRQLNERLKHDVAGALEQLPGPFDAETWLRETTVPHFASSRSHRAFAWLTAAAGFAAIFLFAIFQFRSPRDHVVQTTVAPAQSVAPKPDKETPDVVAVTEADRAWLVRSWQSGRSKLDQWQTRAKSLVEPAPEWKWPPVAKIVETAELASSTAGQALATLDRSVESEQELVTAELKTAYSFFAQRLPTSLAKLVGWKPSA